MFSVAERRVITTKRSPDETKHVVSLIRARKEEVRVQTFNEISKKNCINIKKINFTFVDIISPRILSSATRFLY